VRVSIVIPAYNEEDHLKRCLESIAAQTVTPYEVIVVDNNSTDRTAEVARSFPFVRVVTASQQGIVHARNAGFDAVTGDVIGRIDADVLMPPNWVEHIRAFYADPARHTLAWSGSGYFYNVRFSRFISWAYALLAFRLNVLLTGYSTMWGSNMAITRDQWLAVRGEVHTRTDIHEDLDLTIHLADAGYKIQYDPTVKTTAELRRVVSNREQLWAYTMWWPNTLRLHRRASWLVCWWVSVTVVYPGVYFLAFLEGAARFFGKRPKAAQ
jgi:glycosyltransferase involved in cell wall biosynthesis